MHTGGCHCRAQILPYHGHYQTLAHLEHPFLYSPSQHPSVSPQTKKSSSASCSRSGSRSVQHMASKKRLSKPLLVIEDMDWSPHSVFLGQVPTQPSTSVPFQTYKHYRCACKEAISCSQFHPPACKKSSWATMEASRGLQKQWHLIF